jgi:assimilatory nitrate reductase catalytic subunit
VLLPALAWGEKDGMVTNSDRTISRQRPFLAPPGEARADWRIVCDVARAMGFSGFDFVSPHEIFREHARLTAHGNDGQRALNLGAWQDMTAAEYRNWEPAAWPMAQSRESTRGPMFADGRFAHADGRARFVALTPRGPEHAPTKNYPLVLNTGRVRDHWHTMTRTGKSGRLSAHVAEPSADINTADALRFAVRDGSLATLRSAWGSMVVRVRTSPDIPAGMVFSPIHWNGAYASDARVGALTNPVVDPVSGEPELKHTPVAIEHFAADWYGVMLTRAAVPLPTLPWWVKVQGEKFVRYELAGFNPYDASAAARRLLGVPESADIDWIEYNDTARRVYRAVWFVDDRIEACLYIAPTPALPERDWLGKLFGRGKLDAGTRSSLLAGRTLEGVDPGPLVCSCFGVGRNAIVDCARQLGRAATTAEIGKRLKCGTNCGSCVAEIHSLIQEAQRAPEKRNAS